MPSDRPELSSMADDYARYALSQRAAFEATHPAVLAAARLFADEPVLRVVDLGAADGVNSHGLIRDLAEERAGRPLIYALVDLPTNSWGVAADHLRHAFGGAAWWPRGRRHPPAGRRRPGGRRCRHGSPLRLAGGPRRGLPPSGRAQAAPRHGNQHGRHPPPAGALPARRAACTWGAAGRRCSGSPTRPAWPRPGRSSRATRTTETRPSGEPGAWPQRATVGAAARDARHRARAGRPARRAVGLPRCGPRENGALRGDRRGHEPGARGLAPRGTHRRRHRGGRSSFRRLQPYPRRDPRAPSRRAAGASQASSSRAPSSSVSTIPTGQDDPAVFARGYVRSVAAWGGPLLLRAFAREGEDRAPGLLADFLGELEERVADAPDRYRWDYIEALVICRKADGTRAPG